MNWSKYILIIVSVLWLAPLNAQLQCVDRTDSFQEGEKLEYNLYFNWTAIWLKAGIVSFKIKEGEVEGTPALHAVAEARTPRSFDWIYKVRDKYETYLDHNSLSPLRFVRDVNEGNYSKQLQYTYRPETNEAMVDYVIRKGELKAENQLLEIPACTQDLLSSLYYARSMNYEGMVPNDAVDVDLLMDRKMYDVSFRFLGKDTIEYDGDMYRCNKFVPELIQGGVFEEEDEIIVWVTDDANNLPLYVESDLNFGKIKALLKKHKGLKHELTSKIN